MILDVIVIICVITGLWKGISRGFILSLFSWIGLFIGFIAAMKFSPRGIAYLQETFSWNHRWVPIIAFLGIFGIFYGIAMLLGRVLKTIVEGIFMGWADKLGGAVLGVLMQVTFVSFLFWIVNKTGVLSEETRSASKTYSFVEPVAPAIIQGSSAILPFVDNARKDLEAIFDHLNAR